MMNNLKTNLVKSDIQYDTNIDSMLVFPSSLLNKHLFCWRYYDILMT